MTTFYLDLEGGSDAADGTSFANRWLTFASGATAARIAAGDTIRVMASPEPTLVGNAAWTDGSKTVTLAGAVTANIDLCDAAWTASANVTATASTTRREGTNSASLVIASGFTTGLVAYFATGTLDLSAYQQVSFWIRNSAALAASTLSLKLCSDAAGATPVDTIAIPAIASGDLWTAITVDTGGALGSSIQSVALYADLDPGSTTIRLDNIIACKASSSADSLTLNSLIGKVHNLSWVASATYATNDIRVPTPPNRNGFRYKVTAGGGGAAGSSEPAWPLGIGLTVTDGALTWTCDDLEDTWYPVQSIDGVTVKLDNGPNSSTATTGRGYYGGTEAAVATYKREPITPTILAVFGSAHEIKDSGTAASPITFSGGWNRTDMTTQTGITWVSGRNGAGTGFISGLNVQNWNVINFGLARYEQGWRGFTNQGGAYRVDNCHFVGMDTWAMLHTTSPSRTYCKGVVANNCGDGDFGGAISTSNSQWDLSRVRAENNLGTGISHTTNPIKIYDGRLRNNSVYGLLIGSAGRGLAYSVKMAGNGGDVSDTSGRLQMHNCALASTEFAAMSSGVDGYTASGKHDQTADNHLLTYDGGTVISATDQRHTASGISWKFRPTDTKRGEMYPMVMPVAKLACAASAAVSVTIWTRRSSTDIKGRFRIRGGQLAGVPEQTITCEPSINTWTESSAIAFTPTEDGVVELEFVVWDGVGTTNNYWIDDLTVA